MFSLLLNASESPDDTGIDLGQVTVGDGEIGESDIKTLYLHNTGKSVARDIFVSTESEDPRSVLLSTDGKDWNAIVEFPGSLFPGSHVSLQAKALYGLEDREGKKDFKIIVNAIGVGQ